MPKQTFFNLSNDKRDILVNAGMKEFSRVSLSDASIANIIKEAEISRGSFYQYFENKEDMYFFLLEEYTKKYNETFYSIIEQQKGDIINAFLEFFPMMLENFQNVEHRNFFKIAFLNLNHKVENSLTPHVNEERRKNHFLKMISLINQEQLNISNSHEVKHVIKIIRAVTIHNLVQVFANEISTEDALKNYQFELRLLKNGLYKEEERE